MGGKIIMMRKTFVGILIGLLLVFAGCDDSAEDDGKIEVPFSSEDAVDNMLYTDAENELTNSGFTNIKAVPVEDLITGWLTKDGEIESISIDGDTDFISGRKYDPGVEVEIQYHTFPSDAESEAEESSEGPETDDSQSEFETDKEDEEVPNITVDNNPEFAAVLSNRTDDDSSYIVFAEKYNNQIIEFDGHVEYLDLAENYKTRWEALIVSGDWAGWESVYTGPVFKTRDFNMQEVKFEGLMETGMNVHAVARIEKYDEQAQLFFLDPITITQR